MNASASSVEERRSSRLRARWFSGAPAAEELLAALSETLAAAQIAAPHAEAAFVHAFCRDRSLLLGVEGYALTSLEVALATPPRPDDAVPVAPVPAPPTAVAA